MRLSPGPRLSRVVAAASLAALLALAGCSDSKKDDNAGGTTTPTSAGSTTTVRSVDTSFSGVGSAEFCAFIPSLLNATASLPASASKADIKAGLDTSLGVFDQAVAVAPADIKGDVSIIAEGVQKVAAALADADYDATKLDPNIVQVLTAPGFTDASTRLKAYLEKYCNAGG